MNGQTDECSRRIERKHNAFTDIVGRKRDKKNVWNGHKKGWRWRGL